VTNNAIEASTATNKRVLIDGPEVNNSFMAGFLECKVGHQGLENAVYSA